MRLSSCTSRPSARAFGGIPQSLPPLAWPQRLAGVSLPLRAGVHHRAARLDRVAALARVAEAVIEDRHDPNQELMAQGIANIVSPLFGGSAPPAPSRAP
jgi:SulP family sulfate permease